jgi:enoyl-CoA hydratase
MTQTDKVLARKDHGIGHLIFNNPERHNALSLEMWDAAGSVLDDFIGDGSVRVIVLSGAGGKAFVSGADISRFDDERANVAAIDAYNAVVDRTTSRRSAAIVSAAGSRSPSAATCASVPTIRAFPSRRPSSGSAMSIPA